MTGNDMINHFNMLKKKSGNIKSSYNDNCFDILQKMDDNNLKYINIIGKDNESNFICYEDVKNTCLVQEWHTEEDMKILKELMTEK